MSVSQFNLMVYFLQCASWGILIGQLGERSLRSWLQGLGWLAAMCAATVLLWPFWDTMPVALRAGIMNALLSAGIWLVCGGGWRRRLATVLTVDVLVCAVDMLCVAIIMAAARMPLAEAKSVANGSPARLVGVIMYAPLFIAVSTVWLLWRNRLPGKVKVQLTLLLALLSGICFAYLTTAANSHPTDFVETQSPAALGLTIAIMLCQVFFYQIINSTLEAMKAKQQLEELELRQKMSYEYYLVAREHEEELSHLRHDMKNQLQIAKALMQSRPEQATALLDSLDENLNRTRAMHWTDHEVINTILAVKSNQAARHGIRFTAEVGAGKPPLTDVELTSLLCNLLDNAIEGCQRSGCDRPAIRVRMGERVGLYVLRVENSCSADAFPARGERTVKRDKANHGIGLEVIRQITAAHDGRVSQTAEDGLCVTNVTLSRAA